MDSSDEEDLIMLGFMFSLEDQKMKIKKKRRFWVRKIFKQRETQGVFSNLIKELKLHDREYFFR